MNKLFFIACLLFVLFSSCKDDEPTPMTACEGAEEMILEDLTGLLDGCGWVLNRADGTRLEPLNLGDFEIILENNKAVKVLFDLDPNAASICLVGNIVQITCIEE